MDDPVKTKPAMYVSPDPPREERVVMARANFVENDDIPGSLNLVPDFTLFFGVSVTLFCFAYANCRTGKIARFVRSSHHVKNIGES